MVKTRRPTRRRQRDKRWDWGAAGSPGLSTQNRGNLQLLERAPTDRFERPFGQDMTIGLLNGAQWPHVKISQLAHAKMRALVHECPIEIGWLCSCIDTPDGDILIEDVFVPAQICSLATTEISEEGEGQLLMDLLASNQKDVIRRLRCWGHSHVEMSVFASGPDEKQTQLFLDKGHPYFVRLIANKRDELFCSLYLQETNMVIHNVPLEVEAAPYDDYIKWAQEEIATKVQQEVFTSVSYGSFGEGFDLDSFGLDDLARWRDRGFIDLDLFDRLADQVQQSKEIKQ